MSTRAEKALEYHHKGYNCAQAVACAFSDLVDMSERDIFKAAEGFGFGMGTMGTCGAVSGMALLTGLKMSDGNLEKPASKRTCYQMMQAMTQEFVNMNKSVICRQIKGIDGGGVLRSCDGCVEDAASIVEKMLFNEKEV